MLMVSALKYSTAVPVIFLSALKYHVFPERWTNFYRPFWLMSSVVNSLYSFYWDVTRDWDLRYLKCLFYHVPLIVSLEMQKYGSFSQIEIGFTCLKCFYLVRQWAK